MADTKISALAELAEAPNDADELVLVDKSDTSMAASGTNKKITAANLKSGLITAASTTTFTNKSINANGTGNSITNLEVADFATDVVDTDGTFTANSDTRIPSQKAAKTYSDTKLPASYLDTDGTLAANSDVKVPSQKAAKTYVDGKDTAQSNKWDYINRYGFVDNTETSISFNDSNYVFTLTDAGSGWKYFRNGTVCSITGNKTTTLSGTPPSSNTYYIYIDATDGSLSNSTTAWTLNDTKIPVAMVIWNNGLTPKYWLVDERHTCGMDRAEHRYLHSTKGAQLVSGGSVTGYSTADSSDANNTIAISEAVIADEDMFHTLAELTDPNGTGTPYVVMYRTAAAAYAWIASSMPYKYTSSGYIEYDNSGTTTEGQNAKFYNTYLCLTNITGDARYVILQGRSEFSSASAAYAEDIKGFSFTGLPIAEFVIAYQLTWQTNSSYAGTGKCKLTRAPQRLNITYTSTMATATATDHNSLGGIQGGATGDYYHLTSAQHTVATQAATSSVNGYLTSTDWTTFNGKQAALTKAAGSDVDTGTDDAKYVTSKAIADSALLYNVVEDTTPQLGGDLDLNDKNIQLKAAPGADVTASGMIASFTAHENVAFGDVCFINADGEMAKADADAIASSGVVAMAIATISADAAGLFLLHGIARKDAWSWTPGNLLYLDTATAGGMTATAPSGTDDVIQVIGVATHADRVYFNPQLVMVEHT